MTDSLSETPSFDERFRSYANWPRWAAQEPRDLARAGFRFRNERDLVKCDYCGGKFYNWKKEDDPVVEHMKYFPNCRHLSRLLPDAGNSDGEDIPPATNSRPQRQSRPLVNDGRVTDAVPDAVSSTSSGRRSATSSRGGSSGTKVPVPPVTSGDAKWLRSRMDLPFIQMVLSKGYKRNDVKKVLIANRNENKEVSDAVSLVKQIYELEDKEMRNPNAAWNALKSDPMASSEGIDDAMDGVSKSGDNVPAIESEAKYRDPQEDSRFRCVLPDEQRDAQSKVGKVPEPIASGAAGPGPRRRPTRPEGQANAGRGNATDAVDAKVHDKASGKALCVVCKEEVQGCLFMPCNHLCTCPNCAVKMSKCPVCEKEIMHRLRVYLG